MTAHDDRLPEKIEEAFRLFMDNAQYQHTHGYLAGLPCKEAERLRAAIRGALDEAREAGRQEQKERDFEVGR